MISICRYRCHGDTPLFLPHRLTNVTWLGYNLPALLLSCNTWFAARGMTYRVSPARAKSWQNLPWMRELNVPKIRGKWFTILIEFTRFWKSHAVLEYLSHFLFCTCWRCYYSKYTWSSSPNLVPRTLQLPLFTEVLTERYKVNSN